MEEIDDVDYYVIKMDPRDNIHRYIKSMKIWVNEDSYLINKLEYTDYNDNTSVFEIKNIDIKTKLDDSLFSFTAPPGVEVHDMRK